MIARSLGADQATEGWGGCFVWSGRVGTSAKLRDSRHHRPVFFTLGSRGAYALYLIGRESVARQFRVAIARVSRDVASQETATGILAPFRGRDWISGVLVPCLSFLSIALPPALPALPRNPRLADVSCFMASQWVGEVGHETAAGGRIGGLQETLPIVPPGHSGGPARSATSVALADAVLSQGRILACFCIPKLHHCKGQVTHSSPLVLHPRRSGATTNGARQPIHAGKMRRLSPSQGHRSYPSITGCFLGFAP